MSHVFIIAEPGSTHEGRYDQMIRLVNAAAHAGADCFKNQWTSNAETMAVRRHAPEYLRSYQLLQYPVEWHWRLREHCHALRMKYACSAYLPVDLATLAPLVDALKISSFESRDRAMIEQALEAKRRHQIVTFVSLGMDAEPLTSMLNVSHLLCTSSYPAPLDALGLKRLTNGAWGAVGLSDHSHDVRTGAWAVCAGASVLEAHLRLDDTPETNRDYAVSFTTFEFKEYVRHVRDAELALGDGYGKLHTCEIPMTRYRVRE